MLRVRPLRARHRLTVWWPLLLTLLLADDPDSLAPFHTVDHTRETTFRRLVRCCADLGGMTREILSDRDPAFCIGSTSDGRAILAPEWVELAGLLGVVPRACRLSRPGSCVRRSSSATSAFATSPPSSAPLRQSVARHPTRAAAPVSPESSNSDEHRRRGRCVTQLRAEPGLALDDLSGGRSPHPRQPSSPERGTPSRPGSAARRGPCRDTSRPRCAAPRRGRPTLRPRRRRLPGPHRISSWEPGPAPVLLPQGHLGVNDRELESGELLSEIDSTVGAGAHVGDEDRAGEGLGVGVSLPEQVECRPKRGRLHRRRGDRDDSSHQAPRPRENSGFWPGQRSWALPVVHPP
jgi:hypothetical protein